MSDHDAPLLQEILLTTKDGDWGKDEPADGLLKYQVIRATDFAAASLGDMGNIPVRYLPTHTVGRRTLQENDILMETAGGSPGRPTGRTMLVTARVMTALDGPATCASFARFLRVDSARIDARYLYWFLQSMYQSGEIEQFQVQHTGVARFQYTQFAANQRIPLPELGRQQAIAEVLGALDDKIAANTKLATTADELLAAQLSALLDSGFEEVRLGDIAEVNAETVRSTSGGSLRYIDIASVGIGIHDYPELMSWEDAPSRARRKIHQGDTIWSTVRPNRRSHSLNLSGDPLLVGSTGLAVISPKEVGFAYVYEVTNRPEFTSYLENVAEGSTYPAVRADRFADAFVPRLPQSELDEFEALAAPIRQHIYSLTVENQTLAATRDALLPQLMSGKLRVKEAEALVSAAV